MSPEAISAFQLGSGVSVYALSIFFKSLLASVVAIFFILNVVSNMHLLRANGTTVQDIAFSLLKTSLITIIIIVLVN